MCARVCETACGFDHHGNTDCVIEGAIIDVVAVDRTTTAKMIEMRRHHDILRFQPLVRTARYRNDVLEVISSDRVSTCSRARTGRSKDANWFACTEAEASAERFLVPEQ